MRESSIEIIMSNLLHDFTSRAATKKEIVLFTVPWTAGIKEIKKQFKEYKKKLESSGYQFSWVDGFTERDACIDEKICTFPTIIVYSPGGSRREYKLGENVEMAKRNMSSILDSLIANIQHGL